MLPEMNWAAKLERYSFSLVSRKTSSTSRWRPNVLTMAWPVRDSSTRALSRPVWSHWSTKRGRDRRVMNRMIQNDSGRLTSATRASERRDDEHHDDRPDEHEGVGQQLADGLLKALGQVVDVVGDPAEQVASRRAVDVTERHPVELVLDIGAQPAHRALDHPGEGVRSQVLERRRGDIEPDHDQQQPMEAGEVDALGAHRGAGP